MEMVVTHRSGAAGVVRPIGRLDRLTAPDLQQGLAALIADGVYRLVLDLEAVSFIDSMGLSVFIAGLKAARLASGDLRLARPDDRARYLLQVTALDRVLRIYPTVEEALSGYDDLT